MRKNHVVWLCLLVLTVSSFPSATSDHSPTHSRWSIDVGTSEAIIEQMEFSSEGNLEIPVWIDNRNQISITLTLEYTIPFNADFEGPATLTLDGSSDDSITILLRGVDVENLTAMDEEVFEIVGTVTSRQGLPISVPGDSDSSSIQTIIPLNEVNDTEIIEPVTKEVPSLSAVASIMVVAVAASRKHE